MKTTREKVESSKYASGDNLSLRADDWIKTSPLNAVIPNPQAQGLPPVGASDDEVFRAAERLS
ncbi:MAG: hypothetical protein AABY90_01480, partial [Nitrospirota bacterium]